MFGRKKAEEQTAKSTMSNPATLPDDIPPLPASRQPLAGTVKPASKPTSGPTSVGSSMSNTSDVSANPRPDAMRRPGELPSGIRPASAPGVATPMPSATAPVVAKTSGLDPKTLIVGRDITLNGEISTCNRLVVEGKVEAALSDCNGMEIAESGFFKGAAEVQEADIRGRFDGKLNVRGRLFIRSTGAVTGEVSYGQLEVECGGQVSGTVKAGAAK